MRWYDNQFKVASLCFEKKKNKQTNTCSFVKGNLFLKEINGFMLNVTD